jgi:hypothetical protein
VSATLASQILNGYFHLDKDTHTEEKSQGLNVTTKIKGLLRCVTPFTSWHCQARVYDPGWFGTVQVTCQAPPLHVARYVVWLPDGSAMMSDTVPPASGHGKPFSNGDRTKVSTEP